MIYRAFLCKLFKIQILCDHIHCKLVVSLGNNLKRDRALDAVIAICFLKVRFPKGVFSPYTGINTNILFFEKGGTTEDVWFFEHPYPEGYKAYSRTRPLTIAEFDREKAWWGGATREGRKVNECAWKVSAAEIAARNYNLDCKNPHEVLVNHGEPDELMVEYLAIAQQMRDAQNALKQELIEALQHGVS